MLNRLSARSTCHLCLRPAAISQQHRGGKGAAVLERTRGLSRAQGYFGKGIQGSLFLSEVGRHFRKKYFGDIQARGLPFRGSRSAEYGATSVGNPHW